MHSSCISAGEIFLRNVALVDGKWKVEKWSLKNIKRKNNSAFQFLDYFREKSHTYTIGFGSATSNGVIESAATKVNFNLKTHEIGVVSAKPCGLKHREKED